MSLKNTVRKYEKQIFIFACIILIFFSSVLLIKSVRTHYKFISYPYQLEYREGGALNISQVFLEGRNPYIMNEQPQNTYVYGFLYPLLVTPVANISGNTLPVHRAFVYFFILLTCLLVFYVLVNNKVNFVFAFAAALILHQSIINSANTALARPEGLGIFLFTLGLIIPWKFKFSKLSLVASIVIGILGYLTKPYYIFIIPIVALYLFIFKSKKTGLVYSAVSLLSVLIMAVITSFVFPLFFNNTLVAHFKDSLYSFDIMKDQIIEYVITNAFIFMIMLGAGILIYIKSGKKKSSEEAELLTGNSKMFQTNFNLKVINDEPLIKTKLDLYFIFSFLFILFVFAVSLGGHPGNSHAAYLFHMASSSLILAAFLMMQKTSSRLYMTFAAVLLIICMNLEFKVPKYDFARFAKCFKQMEEVISRSRNVLNSPENVSIMIDQKKTVYNSGLSEYFSGRKNKLHILGPASSEILERVDVFQNEIDKKISRKEFDLILLTKDNYSFFIKDDLLKNNYALSGTVCAPFFFHEPEVEIWIPNKNK